MSRMSAKANNGPMPHDPFFQPFSLKSTFGKRWKIRMDESW